MSTITFPRVPGLLQAIDRMTLHVSIDVNQPIPYNCDTVWYDSEHKFMVESVYVWLAAHPGKMLEVYIKVSEVNTLNQVTTDALCCGGRLRQCFMGVAHVTFMTHYMRSIQNQPTVTRPIPFRLVESCARRIPSNRSAFHKIDKRVLPYSGSDSPRKRARSVAAAINDIEL